MRDLLQIMFSFNRRRPLDMDQFEGGLDHLFSLPEVRSDIGAVVIGNSKGGEIALFSGGGKIIWWELLVFICLSIYYFYQTFNSQVNY